jgi:hypothetical protein
VHSFSALFPSIYSQHPNQYNQATYRLASPVISIRIKEELTFIRKGIIKKKHEDLNEYNRQVHEPLRAAGAFVKTGKRKENEKQQQQNLEFLTDIHCYYFDLFRKAEQQQKKLLAWRYNNNCNEDGATPLSIAKRGLQRKFNR